MDSMINHYTANRKPRNDDAYSPGGRTGLRPDRPTTVYCQRCREAFPGVPVIAGGVEASLRRIAHYDYWSDTVRPSMLVLEQGRPARATAWASAPSSRSPQRLARGRGRQGLRDLRGVAYLLGASEAGAAPTPSSCRRFEAVAARDAGGPPARSPTPRA